MDENLKRKLAIGFLNLSNDKRRKLDLQNASDSFLRTSYAEYSDCCIKAQQVIKWLNETEDGGIIWTEEEKFPVFDGIERNIPYMIFYKGNPIRKDVCKIAVVGTRKVSYKGSQKAFQLGLEISANGCCLVSGMAEGCDQDATEGALSHSGICYEVLGCGLNVNYPSMTSYLKDKIKACGGAVLSAFAPDTPPLKHNFPNRNVIIAALGCFTVLVQAPEKSGSLYTADFSLQMGKDVFVSTEGISGSCFCRGTRSLALEGAGTVEHLSDIDCKFKVQAVPDSNGQYRFADRHYILKTI